MRTVRVRRHVRTIKGRVCDIPAGWHAVPVADKSNTLRSAA